MMFPVRGGGADAVGSFVVLSKIRWYGRATCQHDVDAQHLADVLVTLQEELSWAPLAPVLKPG